MKELYEMSEAELSELERRLRATENNGYVFIFIDQIERERAQRQVLQVQGAGK